RHTDSLWLFQTYDEGETFRFESIDYTGKFEMLYEDVSLEASDRTEDNPVDPTR
ncbi:MAG TPA: Uma2 family endonuclease, partial [Oscillatoriales cyanobacterium M59_W2019_021]|nr:Uma2 family endonuclease [Oscillatoriales cyanobacterium M59_W2019_021]